MDAQDVRSTPPQSRAVREPLQAALGRRLRRLRDERGLSPNDVAIGLGIPQNHVDEHERGARRFAPEDVVAYALLFGVSISSFFGDPAGADTGGAQLYRPIASPTAALRRSPVYRRTRGSRFRRRRR